MNAVEQMDIPFISTPSPSQKYYFSWEENPIISSSSGKNRMPVNVDNECRIMWTLLTFPLFHFIYRFISAKTCLECDWLRNENLDNKKQFIFIDNWDHVNLCKSVFL